MTPQEIIEGNKLIAEFMGITIDFWQKRWFVSTYSNMKYHLSWDWLMEVVNKIRSIYNSAQDVPFDVIDILAEGCIEANILQVYQSVVDFIKWYNQNKLL